MTNPVATESVKAANVMGILLPPSRFPQRNRRSPDGTPFRGFFMPHGVGFG